MRGAVRCSVAAEIDVNAEPLWSVHVTAPVASSRVQVVAAEASTRLKLPADKLVALLDNRIGPVTKPLPRASAQRVADVLDAAGVMVELQRADAGLEAMAPEPVASDVVWPAAAAPEAHAPDPAGADPGAASHAWTKHREDPSSAVPPRTPATAPWQAPVFDSDGERELREEAEAAHDVGSRSSVEHMPASPAGSQSDRVPPSGKTGMQPHGRAPGHAPQGTALADAWNQFTDAPVRDDLGGWARDTAAGSEPGSGAAWSTASSRSELDRTLGGQPQAHMEAPAANGNPWMRRSATSGLDLEDAAPFGPGMRDPFAEAERRERTVRRVVLGIALMIATAVLVLLQLGYA